MKEEVELKVQMLGAELLVTTNTETVLSDSELILPEASDMSENLDEHQIILKAGPDCRYVKEGNKVRLRINNLQKAEANWVKRGNDDVQDGVNYIIDPNKVIEIEGNNYFIIRESDVAYIVE